jgi:hypothetical protein
MKKLYLYIICFITLFILTSCDFWYYTYVTVVNESSYDLAIYLKYKNNRVFYNDVIEAFGVKKEGFFEFVLLKHGGMYDEYFNPNEEIVFITFSDINTNEIIKTIVNMNLFVFIGPKKGKMPNYFLIINDELLYKE